MYQALYRKYRPYEFNDVVGQKIIVNALKNAINFNHISHAYLFSGPRGTGKTTVAKIFARAVNCMEPISGLACGKCKNCECSFSKECMDIIEIDAASNNGIDEIRELRNKVSVLPTELKYKVYIIDEVHMLTIGAFNALLKTIEEPPKHVIFILATTDPQKIPTTIISRCQWYSFKKITNEEIVNRLSYIVKSEKIDVDNIVLEKIAYASDGGLRDAIGLLDKLRSYSNKVITLDDFYEVNGEVAEDDVKKLEGLIFTYNIPDTINFIENKYQSGKNMIQIVKQLMILIKNELFDYYIKNIKPMYDEGEMVDFLNLLNSQLVEIKKADDVKLSLEIFLLHYINENVSNNENEKQKSNQVDNSEKTKKNLDSTIVVEKNKNNKKISNDTVEKDDKIIKEYEELMLVRSKNIMISASKEALQKELINFQKLNDYTFDLNNGYLACELLDGKIRAVSNDGIIISYEYDSMIDKLSNHFSKLIDFYNEITLSSKKIAFITLSKWETLRKEYIELHKIGKQFEYQEEPNLNNIKNDAKMNVEQVDNVIDETVKIFGDLVEIK